MMLYKNGDIYSGEWSLNKRHGYGRFLIKDKGEYEGEWQYDKMEGQGTLK